MKKLPIALIGGVIFALSTSTFAANKVTIDFSNATLSGNTLTAQSSDVLDAGPAICTGKNLPKGAKVTILDNNRKVLTTFQAQGSAQFTQINPTLITIQQIITNREEVCNSPYSYHPYNCPVFTCIVNRQSN